MRPNSRRNHITRENPKEQYIRVEDNRLCYFFLVFLFFSIYLDLGLEVSMILHMTITNCHTCHCHMIIYYTKEYGRF